jgi:hypothetical protein
LRKLDKPTARRIVDFMDERVLPGRKTHAPQAKRSPDRWVLSGVIASAIAV